MFPPCMCHSNSFKTSLFWTFCLHWGCSTLGDSWRKVTGPVSFEGNHVWMHQNHSANRISAQQWHSRNSFWNHTIAPKQITNVGIVISLDQTRFTADVPQNIWSTEWRWHQSQLQSINEKLNISNIFRWLVKYSNLVIVNVVSIFKYCCQQPGYLNKFRNWKMLNMKGYDIQQKKILILSNGNLSE